MPPGTCGAQTTQNNKQARQFAIAGAVSAAGIAETWLHSPSTAAWHMLAQAFTPAATHNLHAVLGIVDSLTVIVKAKLAVGVDHQAPQL